MKNLFESLEDIALQIFTEGFADKFKANPGRLDSRIKQVSTAETQPSITTRIAKHLPAEAKARQIDNDKKIADITTKLTKNTPVANLYDGLNKGSQSPTKLALLSYMRWAYTGFELQEPDDFIEEFHKKFGDTGRFGDKEYRFFYKLGTGAEAQRGVATFKDIDASKIKEVVKDISDDKKIYRKDARLRFEMSSGGKRLLTGTDGEGQVEDKTIKTKRAKTFTFSRHQMHYVLPLPIFGGYRKYARFIRFVEPTQIATGITVSELFIMDASEFSGEEDTTYTRGLYYFNAFDRFVAIADNLAKYMFATTMPDGFRRMKNDISFGQAYQTAINRIERMMKIQYNQLDYQPNFTDINNVMLQLVKTQIGLWTPDVLENKLPELYIEKITGDAPVSSEQESEKQVAQKDSDRTTDENIESPDDTEAELEINEEDL